MKFLKQLTLFFMTLPMIFSLYGMEKQPENTTAFIALCHQKIAQIMEERLSIIQQYDKKGHSKKIIELHNKKVLIQKNSGITERVQKQEQVLYDLCIQGKAPIPILHNKIFQQLDREIATLKDRTKSCILPIEREITKISLQLCKEFQPEQIYALKTSGKELTQLRAHLHRIHKCFSIKEEYMHPLELIFL